MTTSPNRTAVIVGLFVTASITILAGGILAVGNLNDTFATKITVSVVFDEVSGLQKGDNVWFSGLKVGTVSNLEFHGDSQVEVELKVDQEATPHIHKDALAKVGSDGLIGNRIVVLYDGTTDAPTIKEGDVLAVGETVSTEAIMEMLQTNNTNLLAITNDIKGITSKIAAGEGTIGKLLKDDALYTNVTQAVDTLNAASVNARNLTGSLATFSAKLNREGGLPNDLVTDRTSYASLTATVDKIKHVGDRAAEMVDGLALAVADKDSSLGVVLHDEAVGAELKQTLANLNDSTVLLNEDLKAIQSNFLFRGYFKKQEKEAKKAAAEAERGN